MPTSTERLDRAEEKLEESLRNFITIAKEKTQEISLESFDHRIGLSAFVKKLHIEFPKILGAPPGYRVIDVKDDGNCFYHAVFESIKDPSQGSPSDAQVEKAKKKLLEYYETLDMERKKLMPGVERRLRTPKEWAQEHEILLMAEKLKTCIFVFRQRWRQPYVWGLHLFASPDVLKKIHETGNAACLYDGTLVYDAMKYGVSPAASAVALKNLVFCSECPKNSIYLLNLVRGDTAGYHYQCLRPMPNESLSHL